MRNLIDFKNIHQNKDIYVIASGKSLDFFDISFFKNKITIGINQVYHKFTTNYLIRKEHILLDSIMKKKLKSIIFVSKYNKGGYKNNSINKEYIEQKYQEHNKLVIYDHNDNKHDFKKIPDGNKLLVSWSTIVSGIHLAAYMGAKNIILVAHDCGTIDGKGNFDGYHSDNEKEILKDNVKTLFYSAKEKYIKFLYKIEAQTIKLKKMLKKKYGCNIFSLNPFINFGLEGHKYKKL